MDKTSFLSKWEKRFIDLAEHIAQWSKDPSKKVGAVIVNDFNRVVSIGFNGFPSGCNDDIPERYSRPAKYYYTEHAERNAIYSAAFHGVSLYGTIIYVNVFPCSDCARAIIQSGIRKLIAPVPEIQDKKDKDSDWAYSFTKSAEMMDEVGIDIVTF